MENREKQEIPSTVSYEKNRGKTTEKRQKRRHQLRHSNKGRFAKAGRFTDRRKRRETLRGDGRFKSKRPALGKQTKFAKRRPLKQRKGKSLKAKRKRLEPITSDLQITGGRHRGKLLQSTASPKIQITPSAVRQELFRALRRRVRMKRFLDLCAGAGTVGMEALSRGALLCTFVERSAKMCSFIRKNMEICGIKEGHGEIFQIEAVPFLKRMKKRHRYWDIVYFNPPYDANYEEVLLYFAKGAAVCPKGGILVIEHPTEMFFEEKLGVLKRTNVLTIGNTGLTFYERVA